MSEIPIVYAVGLSFEWLDGSRETDTIEVIAETADAAVAQAFAEVSGGRLGSLCAKHPPSITSVRATRAAR